MREWAIAIFYAVKAWFHTFDYWHPGKKSVAVPLDKEGFSTSVNTKKIGCRQSTIARVIKLKRETGDIEGIAWSGWEMVTATFKN